MKKSKANIMKARRVSWIRKETKAEKILSIIRIKKEDMGRTHHAKKI